MLRIERLLIARMPVMMDVSNHDSDGVEFDVVVGARRLGSTASPRSAVSAPWQ
jgi:hypothetical protein